jgi:hypothetical protein
VVEQLPEHELAYGSEPAWERGEGEAVAEQQSPRASGCEAATSSRGRRLGVVEVLLPEKHQAPPSWRAKCRSGFTTLPPAPLPESSPLWFFFLEWAQIAQGVGYEGIRWTRGFTWFGPPKRNTLRPRVNGVVLLCLSVRLKSPFLALGVCPNLL